MEEKEEIKRLKKLIKLRKNKRGEIKFDTCICCTADLETVLNLLEKKDNIIDKTIDYIMTHSQTKTMKKTFCKDCIKCNGIKRECIKQYFEKKVSETNEQILL